MKMINAMLVIFVLSTNLMLGQQNQPPPKTDSPAARTCSNGGLQREPLRYELFLPQFEGHENVFADCPAGGSSSSDLLVAGSFFGFSAF